MVQCRPASLISNREVSSGPDVEFKKSKIALHGGLKQVRFGMGLNRLRQLGVGVLIELLSLLVELLLPLLNEEVLLLIRSRIKVHWKRPLKCVCARDEKEDKTLLCRLCLPV